MEPSEEVKGSNICVPSSENSQPESGERHFGDRKKRVGFTGEDDPSGRSPRASWEDSRNEASTSQTFHASDNREDVFGNTLTHLRSKSSKSHLPELTPEQTHEIQNGLTRAQTVSIPRPGIRKTRSNPNDTVDLNDDDLQDPFGAREHDLREARMREAVERAKRLEDEQRSAPVSTDDFPEQGDPKRYESGSPMDFFPKTEHDDGENDSNNDMPTLKKARARTYLEAERLVQEHTRGRRTFDSQEYASGFQSGAATPIEEQNYANDYRPRPDHYRGGVFDTILRFYGNRQDGYASHQRSGSMASLSSLLTRGRRASASSNLQQSPPLSDDATPTAKRWFPRMRRNHSAPSLTQFAGSSASLSLPAVSALGEKVSQKLKEEKKKETHGRFARSPSASALAALSRISDRQRRLEEEVKITLHIAETIARQKYLMRLCQALMMYGAPTHRLEEYMRMSARVLEVDAQFLYIPGSMIISLDDNNTHTTEVKLVKVAQGLDLGKLRDVHEVYKDVVHDRIGVDEATQSLRDITTRKPKHSRRVRILACGIGAATVGPFAFQARMIDLPIIFLLGCILGTLQIVVAPKSDLFANVFEVAAAVICSFLARAFGSIWNGEKRLFCFSALAQSSIALILPGYVVLTASLELQSKNIIAGSVRMVYAIIYSLFLGYGITIGTAIYGLMDAAASSETTCADPLPSKWYFLFVPIYTICLIIMHQAKWRQAPVMLVIALIGYVVNFFSAKRFVGNTQVSNTLGALAIGVLANLYSRVASRVENWAIDRWEHDLRQHWRKLRRRGLRNKRKRNSPGKLEEGGAADDESVYQPQMRRVGYGLAVAAMLPAIFVQVPSGLSLSGSLVSGIASANQIAGNATNGTTVLNTTAITSASSGIQTDSIAFTVSYSVIQVAIGITVGLFLSAIVVYPLGKRRSGLFSL